MDQFLNWLTRWVERGVVNTFGPVTDQAVAGPIKISDVLCVLIYLALAFIIDRVIAWIVLRRARALAVEPGSELPHRVLSALAKPLTILIWIYALYFAATPLIVRLPPEQGLALVRGVMDFVFDMGAFAALFWFLFRLTHVLESHLARWAAGTPSKIDDLLVPLLGTSMRVIVIVLAIILGLPRLRLPPESANFLSKLTSILLIIGVAILAARAVSIFQSVVYTRFDITAADNLRARKVYTQIHVMSRVVYVVIGVFAVSAILMLFQEVRVVGTDLLASAGVMGIIAGFAAQKTLANLFAGFQIAMAQPVRQDDVVVVEGEWGRVEEITLTYVVVRIWDERRLVLPLSYFIEKPFQNWTRTASEIMGSVFVWVDYTFPVEAGRNALKGIIEGSPLWDKRFWNLQVSDTTDKVMQLRVLATSASSSISWDLRCEIREKFIEYIQRNHPGALPQLRIAGSTAAP